jgi:Holliday junction resolvase RusA-like endonuclease
MPTELTFVVHGTPAPQGSKTRMPNGAMVESSKRVAPWREAVRHAAETAIGATTDPPYAAPYAVALVVVFTMKRPASHYGTGRNAHRLSPNAPTHPRGRPDLDKLIRSTLDALSDSGAITDDATITTITATKCYPGTDLDALDTPGATIHLRELP